MKAAGEVVFLLSAPVSGLWQMGAAVTGEILLISCNLSPLHAQSLVPFQPHTDGWLEEAVDTYCRTFSEVYTVGMRKKIKRWCASAQF